MQDGVLFALYDLVGVRDALVQVMQLACEVLSVDLVRRNFLEGE